MTEVQQQAISRRGALRGFAAATAAGVAAPTLVPAAHAIGADDTIHAVRAHYALPGGRVIAGYFAAPRGKTNLETIVILHGEGGIDNAALSLANGYARAGKLAVIPDMPGTFTVPSPAAQK